MSLPAPPAFSHHFLAVSSNGLPLRIPVDGRKLYVSRDLEEINKVRSTSVFGTTIQTNGLIRYRQVTIDVLPDDVILEIFDFYMDQARPYPFEGIEAWHTLVHVCRHWRNVVFGSPLRLNLQLLCTTRTPVRDVLDVWPAFPILIRDHSVESISELDLDNITAVLEHNDRICEIVLYEVPNSLLETVTAALIQKPFSALTQLELVAHHDATTPAVPPEPFRDGSAPHLRDFILDGIPIPDLPKLLSATHLIDLALWNIPHSGYVSPQAMVTCLSTLTSLEQLYLDFQLPQSRPEQGIQRPLTRSVLPSLTIFGFSGVSEYLEDFIARIDAPRLNQMDMTFINQIVFDASQLVHFINRSPYLKAPDEALVHFDDVAVWVTLSSPETGELKVEILADSHWQLSSVTQACSSFSPSFSTVKNLYIYHHQYPEPHWPDDDIENTQWLEILRPFTIVEKLYLSELFASRIAPALQVLVEERMTEVLPILQNIFVEGLQPSGPVQEGIGQFVAARQLSGHPITVSSWLRT